uniref:Uncharacterized protein n=1 Tax=Globodera rostochiensis TaxID=31243 RepID=A0A914HSV5_GLORO
MPTLNAPGFPKFRVYSLSAALAGKIYKSLRNRDLPRLSKPARGADKGHSARSSRPCARPPGHFRLLPENYTDRVQAHASRAARSPARTNGTPRSTLARQPATTSEVVVAPCQLFTLNID